MFVLRIAAVVGTTALASLTTLGGCASDPVHTPSPTHELAQLEFAQWEPASFERAAAEDKLILINVIATWCHWCHVMDEQTFANPEVAGLLADHFVVIRVDSDARPDVSERYRPWGWPATAFLSPEAEPVLNLRGYRDPEVFATLLRELIAEHQRGELRQLDAREHAGAPTDTDLETIHAFAAAQLDGYFDDSGLGWVPSKNTPGPNRSNTRSCAIAWAETPTPFGVPAPSPRSRPSAR